MLHAELEHGKNPHQYRLTPEQVIEAEMLDTVKLDKRRRAWAARRGSKFTQEYEYHCGAGINGFHIDPAGRLSLCMMVRDAWYDLRQGSFRDGWQTFMKDQRFAKSTRHNPCVECDLFALCGECPGRAKVEQDSPGKPNSFYCQLAHTRDHLLSLSEIS